MFLTNNFFVSTKTGGIKVIIDVGWYRDEVNTDIPNVDLTNGQQHVVSVRRINSGRTMIVAVKAFSSLIVA